MSSGGSLSAHAESMGSATKPRSSTPRFRIDLYSDTQTRPTSEMRRVIAEAEVGDEQHQEDPSVNALLERVCQLLGQDAAIFLPSGTMANEIALLVHCQRGDEVLAHETAHIYNFEGGAPAAIAGVMVRSLQGARGLFDVPTLQAAIRAPNRSQPRSRLLVVEQTSNLGGGTVWPLEQIRDVVACARENSLSVHLDGARLMNAAVASGLTADRFASMFDTVFVDFTKGLGAPLGAILAGKQACIDEAWRWKQRMGGSMRQSGMMAAACLYSLDHHVERLNQDHANAQWLAERLGKLAGFRVEPVDTNIVIFDIDEIGLDAKAFNAELNKRGLRLSVLGPKRLRAVTHLDTPRPLVEEAMEIIDQALAVAPTAMRS